jgi:hypothetical protein
MSLISQITQMKLQETVGPLCAISVISAICVGFWKTR